jgi:nucleotide-binding universal stress UspA family protein
MAEIKKILFATDFSKGAARASEMAITLTKLSGAELILLHVITELAEVIFYYHL